MFTPTTFKNEAKAATAAACLPSQLWNLLCHGNRKEKLMMRQTWGSKYTHLCSIFSLLTSNPIEPNTDLI